MIYHVSTNTMANLTGKLLNNFKPSSNSGEKFNLIQYLKDSKAELKKVSWPTKKATWRNTWVVIGFSVLVAFFLGLLDFVFSYGLEWYLSK